MSKKKHPSDRTYPRSVRIPGWMLDRIEKLKPKRRRELSTIIRVALAEYLATREAGE